MAPHRIREMREVKFLPPRPHRLLESSSQNFTPSGLSGSKVLVLTHIRVRQAMPRRLQPLSRMTASHAAGPSPIVCGAPLIVCGSLSGIRAWSTGDHQGGFARIVQALSHAHTKESRIRRHQAVGHLSLDRQSLAQRRFRSAVAPDAVSPAERFLYSPPAHSSESPSCALRLHFPARLRLRPHPRRQSLLPLPPDDRCSSPCLRPGSLRRDSPAAAPRPAPVAQPLSARLRVAPCAEEASAVPVAGRQLTP